MGILTVQTDDGPIEVIPVNKQEMLELEPVGLEPLGSESVESENNDNSEVQQEKQGHRGSSKKANKK